MKKIIVNAEDFSVYMPPFGDYDAEPVKVSGNYGGYMLSGEYEEDTLAIKWRVTMPLRPLTDEEAAVILNNLRSGKYVSLSFYDPERGDMRETEATYRLPKMRRRSGLVGGARWFAGSLEFEER